MRKIMMTCAGAAALFMAVAHAPPVAQAMTIAAPAGLGKAAQTLSLTEDVAFVCSPGWRWRRCWWTPGYAYYRPLSYRPVYASYAYYRPYRAYAYYRPLYRPFYYRPYAYYRPAYATYYPYYRPYRIYRPWWGWRAGGGEIESVQGRVSNQPLRRLGLFLHAAAHPCNGNRSAQQPRCALERDPCSHDCRNRIPLHGACRGLLVRTVRRREGRNQLRLLFLRAMHGGGLRQRRLLPAERILRVSRRSALARAALIC
jgi:hypothetical protein